MLSGATLRACDMTGTAVFRIVVSSDSMKNATATSHGKSCLLEADGGGEEVLMRCVPKLRRVIHIELSIPLDSPFASRLSSSMLALRPLSLQSAIRFST